MPAQPNAEAGGPRRVELRAAFDGSLGAVRARDAPLTEEWVVPASAEPGDRVSVTTRLGESHAFFVPQGAAPGTVLQYPSRSGHTGDTLEGNGRLQETERFTLNLPWLPPFSDAAVSEHPLVLAILEREARLPLGGQVVGGARHQRDHRVHRRRRLLEHGERHALLPRRVVQQLLPILVCLPHRSHARL